MADCKNIDPQKYGPWALVTGAAQGLGAEFAQQIAAAGINLILLDINKEGLACCEKQLGSQFSVDVITVPIDLSKEGFLDQLLPQIEGLEVGLLVNNAGISKIGPFLLQSREFLLAQLHVNTRAVLLLSHHFSQLMVKQGRGGIIILASGAAELSSAYNANYCGTKAYDLKLAESLWSELGPKGVDVLGFMPGMTATEGYVEAGGDQTEFLVMSAEETVREALDNLGKRPSVFAGKLNRAIHYTITSLLPRSTLIKMVSKRIEKMFKVS